MNNRERILAISKKLELAFSIGEINVIDDSEQHRGHEGAKSGKGHFTVEIESAELSALPRVKAHQAIYAALDDLMDNEIHALSIKLQKRP